MGNPVPYWQSDPDYYSNNDPDRKGHLQRIKENLHIDKLIDIASSDGSYSLRIPKKT